MDFENDFSSPITLASLIINLENNVDVECGEGYIIGANGRKPTSVRSCLLVVVKMELHI